MTTAPVILVVDDHPSNLRITATIIEDAGFIPVLAMNGRDALDYCSSSHVDLVLLDVRMPGMDGFEVMKRLKEDRALKELPVIFVTALTDKENLIRAFDEGAVDYMIKPFQASELNARLKTHIELNQYKTVLKMKNRQLEHVNGELRTANDVIQERNNELNELLEKLDHLSRVDPLTNAYNRRHMMERLTEAHQKFTRERSLYSVILFDIDWFKSINDQYGHDGGDAVLKEMAIRTKALIRKNDVLARWGGEEFFLLMPNTTSSAAEQTAETIRRHVQEQSFPFSGLSIRATISVGVATSFAGDTIETLIKRADLAMYEAKQSGRNRVVTKDFF